ncbi:hypothetical protein V757_00285 [Pelistega indica]|uniref:Uncharacterized protein n=1 Tax=Pelistega indica TaxID=1414851 RepID=V8GBG1_9BURK|nr:MULTISPECIES: hypothetical protein [Pelistega]ETD73087.1 hypothetical protein V757_00285 [Pelistega indica]
MKANHNNNSAPVNAQYRLIKSDRESYSTRLAQDWTYTEQVQPRGLRHDLRQMSQSLSSNVGNGLMMLLWISIIPSISLFGTLAGY